MNVDHIYRRADRGAGGGRRRRRDRLHRHRPHAGRRRHEGRARRRAGACASIAKTLTTFDAGYVGMTKVPAAARRALLGGGRRRRRPRRGAPSTSSGCWRGWPTAATRPLCRDISGHGWLEVDLPEERDHADEVLGRVDFGYASRLIAGGAECGHGSSRCFRARSAAAPSAWCSSRCGSTTAPVTTTRRSRCERASCIRSSPSFLATRARTRGFGSTRSRCGRSIASFDRGGSTFCIRTCKRPTSTGSG